MKFPNLPALFQSIPMKKATMWMAGIAVLMIPMVAMAGESKSADLKLAPLIMGLAGGLAIFLFGMELMGDSLKQVAGDRMRKIIGALSSNRFAGVATGAGTTAVVQSSSVTTVMVVGFITAGLMTMPQALGVILGANIGTTITGQIIAFKVTHYAMWLIAAGFFTHFVVKQPQIRKWALVFLGLGLVFFGLTLMGDAMKPLRGLAEFRDLMAGGNSMVVAVLIGAAFTALVQSSSATTGIVIVMAADGIIPLETGIALALGANIGTCVTAGLAAIGKPREAVRAAVAHAAFNILGVVLVTPFIHQFTAALEWAFVGADAARQIANAHTVFNVANTIAFLPFLGGFAKLLVWLVPDKKESDAIGAHLVESLASTPGAALELARTEILALADNTRQILSLAPAIALHADDEAAVRVGALHQQAQERHAAISKYLTLVTTERMSSEDADDLLELMGVATRLRSIGNVVRFALPGHGAVELRGEASDYVKTYHAAVQESFDAAIEAMTHADADAAPGSLAVEDRLDALDHDIHTKRRAEAVSDESGADLVVYDKQLSVIDDLRRVYFHASSIARDFAVDDSRRMAA